MLVLSAALVLRGSAVLAADARPDPEAALARSVLRIATWECYLDPARPDRPLAWEDFERGSGAIIEARAFGSNEEIAAAAASGRYDLVIAPCDLVPVLIERGLLAPAPTARLANYGSLQPHLRRVRYGLAGGQDHCVPYAWGPLALAYDTAVFPEPPRSWEILWDPAWAGRVGHWDNVAALWTAALADGRRDCFGLAGQSLWEAGRRAARLCAQSGLLWHDDSSQVAAMAAGRIVLNATWPSVVAHANRAAERASGSWAMVYPDEGVTGFVDNLCVTTSCRDVRLAWAFVDAALAPAAQVAMSDLTDFGPVSVEAARRLPPRRRAQLHLDDPNHLNRLILWRPVANVADYARIWDEARSGRLVQ